MRDGKEIRTSIDHGFSNTDILESWFVHVNTKTSDHSMLWVKVKAVYLKATPKKTVSYKKMEEKVKNMSV
jgi:hypothetical protein